jgi:hypothetical protein
LVRFRGGASPAAAACLATASPTLVGARAAAATAGGAVCGGRFLPRDEK